MTEPTLRVLHLEDSVGDADLVRGELDAVLGPAVVVERVASEDALQTALAEFEADVVLANRPLGRDATSSYDTLRTLRPAAPLIVVADGLDEDGCVSCLRGGPDDLVFKSNLGRLPSAIESAIEARKPLARLSPRQIEVLRLVVDGCSTREIADRLGLSVKTVESHRGAMMKRLGLHDVAGLVRYAVRMGLTTQ